MADNIFTRISKGLPPSINPQDIVAARQWFRDEALKTKRVNVNQIFQNSRKSMTGNINISAIGSMFLFNYNPKMKDTLPFYDIFPLTFIVELYKDGFLGINLHYLNPYMRAKLMDALYTIALKQGDKIKLQLSYRVLKSATKFKGFQPCLKRYLFSHMQSKFLFIEPGKWDTVLMLPTQRFVKTSADVVWKHSQDVIGGR